MKLTDHNFALQRFDKFRICGRGYGWKQKLSGFAKNLHGKTREINFGELIFGGLAASKGQKISKGLLVWDHPFKTSACCRGGGVKILPNLPTVGGRGQKSVKICLRLKWVVPKTC